MKEVSNGLRLDIACGNRKKPDFIGVDICSTADVVCDLEKFPWPFEDASVDEVYCAHYIEHTKDLIAFFNELYRIMKPGATAEIIAPYYSSIKAWQDPTHVRAISENTFYYCNREWRLINKLGHYPITADFDYNFEFMLMPSWEDKAEEEIRYAIRHFINVVSAIKTHLTKRGSRNQHRYKMNEEVAQLWSDGKIDEAVSLGKKLINSELADFFTWLILGASAIQSGEYLYAIDAFRTAFSLEYNSQMAHAGFMVATQKAGLKEQAEEHLKNIAEFDHEFAENIRFVMSMITEGE